MFQKVAAQIEEILLGRIQARRSFVLKRRLGRVAGGFLYVSQQIVKLRLISALQQLLDKLSPFVERFHLQVSQREIVAIGVVRRIEGLRLFEVRDADCNASLLQVVFAQPVIGVGRASEENAISRISRGHRTPTGLSTFCHWDCMASSLETEPEA